MKTRWMLAVAVLVASSSPAGAADPAQRLLDETAATYAALRTYSDTGTADVDDDDATVFATAFERPDHLRFAWTKTFMFFKHRALLVADGRQVTTMREDVHGNPTFETRDSLSLGVAGATGVSLGAARTIATLLLPHLWDGPEPFGSSALSIRSPRLVGDEAVEKTPCRHVTGTTEKGNRIDVWIGTQDHLVRRVDTTLQGYVYREVHRDIRVDQAIPATVFAVARPS